MMSKRIRAQIKPNNRQFEGVIKANGLYLIQVKAPALDGKANQRAIEILAEYFQIAKSRIKLINGRTSRHKTFEIN